MTDTIELEAAAVAAAAARERLTVTVQDLKRRLDPETLVEEVRTSASHVAREVAEQAGDAARRRPGVVAGVGAVAVLYILRRPIRRLFRRRKATDAASRR